MKPKNDPYLTEGQGGEGFWLGFRLGYIQGCFYGSVAMLGFVLGFYWNELW